MKIKVGFEDKLKEVVDQLPEGTRAAITFGGKVIPLPAAKKQPKPQEATVPTQEEEQDDEQEKTPKQTTVPGTDGPRLPSIETAADHYVDTRDKRMALTKKEGDAMAVLDDAMSKAIAGGKIQVNADGIAYYRCRTIDEIVEYNTKHKIRVRKPKADGTPADEE